jgi:hypothetical protein
VYAKRRVILAMVIQDLKATWAYIETGRAVDDFVERDNRKLSQPDVLCLSYSSP